MNLHIENIAKIRNANIGINGITVIAGENNTGKSTVGKVLYSIYESFYHIEERIVQEKRRALENFIYRRIMQTKKRSLIELFMDELFLLDEQIFTDVKQLRAYLVEPLNQLHFRGDVLEDAISYIYKTMNTEGEVILRRIVQSIFNDEFKGQIKTFHQPDASIELKLKHEQFKLKIDEDNAIDIKESSSIIHRLIYIDDPTIIDNLNEYFSRFRMTNHKGSLSYILNHKADQSILEELFAKEQFGRILNKIQCALQGSFIETEDGIAFQEHGCEAPLHIENLSMGLKSFAILQKLIEDGHIEQHGILLLDEPEVHLHPKWQLIYAEILVILQKELEMDIVLTTHSPYFINAIEVYSAKYEIADRCKYYLSEVKNHSACFKDVTTEIDQIYEKLAMPLQQLEDMV